MYQCYQVRVQYIDVAFQNNTFVDEYQDRDWKNLSRLWEIKDEDNEDKVEVRFIYTETPF